MLSKPKVALALSGGSDSAWAGWLLQKQGYALRGFYLRLGQKNQEEERRAARAVAQRLRIPFQEIKGEKIFQEKVIQYFLQEYQRGRTPNPCVKCNQWLKFGLLYQEARKQGCAFLATGHYLRLRRWQGEWRLYRGQDKKKDQSYFLYSLKKSQLGHLKFPLGTWQKKEVEKRVRDLGLPILPSSSQDICFLGGEDHNVFLKKHLKLKKGKIITLAGREVGEHEGLPLYTIGQRRYIKIGGIGPFYAAKMDYQKNILYVAQRFDDPIFYAQELVAEEVNWLARVKFPLKCWAQIRYLHPAERCVVKKAKVGYKVIFSQPQRAITSGQAVVFYQKSRLLGGGIIK